jgi:6-phosphogluconate dehydrogenase
MQLGMVGLGRMGSNMVRRLMRAGHTLSVTDLSAEAVATMAKEGATGASSLKDLVASLAPPRAVWVMVPAGGPTEQTVMTLGDLLSAGDAIVDGGNSWFKDDVRRARALAPKGVHYVDAGTSGGVWGAERGYCLMVGGPAEAVSRLEPLLASLAFRPRLDAKARRAPPRAATSIAVRRGPATS